MIVFKLIGKLLAVPCILVLGVLLLTYGKLEKIINLAVGLVNILVVLGAVASVIMTGSWDMAKQVLILFVIEGVVLVIPQFCAESMGRLKERLLDFVWA